MGNKALDGLSLPPEEPSVRSPVPVQPQQQALIPPPVRVRRTRVPTAVRLEAPWLLRSPCKRARACTPSITAMNQ